MAWSGVRSQTHVIYAASWLRRLVATTSGEIMVTNLGLGGFLGKNPVNHDDIRQLLPQGLTYHDCGIPPVGAQNYYLSTGAVGIKPWLKLAAIFRRPFTTVVTDEGLGSYGTWQTRRDASRRESRPLPTTRALAGAAATRWLTGERWATYLETETGWQINPKIAAEFSRHAPGNPTNRAVFLSQPWVELGLISAAEYLDLLQRVARIVSQKGLEFAVRPHPVEAVDRYSKWPTIAGFRPAELDPRITGAPLIIGTTSTALLNLSALLGRKTVRIVDPGLEIVDTQLGDEQRRLLNFYLGSGTRLADLGHQPE